MTEAESLRGEDAACSATAKRASVVQPEDTGRNALLRLLPDEACLFAIRQLCEFEKTRSGC
jgi:hypothetical protein